MVKKNLSANAGNTGSIPGLGRSHMAAEQLSLCTTTEVQEPRACAPQQEKQLQCKACALQLENSPYLLQLQKAYMQQQRLTTAKK